MQVHMMVRVRWRALPLAHAIITSVLGGTIGIELWHFDCEYLKATTDCIAPSLHITTQAKVPTLTSEQAYLLRNMQRCPSTFPVPCIQ